MSISGMWCTQQQRVSDVAECLFIRGLEQILYGNVAPSGSVAKITGKEGLYFRGPARVFDSEEAMLAALSEDPSGSRQAQSDALPWHFPALCVTVASSSDCAMSAGSCCNERPLDRAGFHWVGTLM